jgi:hypothetical protein
MLVQLNAMTGLRRMLASVVFRTSIPPQVIAVQLHQVEA